MLYQIKLAAKVIKELKKLDKKERSKISKQLVYLAANPFLGKKLQGEWEEHYSLRAWPYRIIYKIYKEDLVVLVVEIGHRQGVYN